MELLTAVQMRAIEQAAIQGGEVTGLELMERAGAGVVEAIFEWRPELAEGERRAVVLCGPGNNGGDGFVVARLLKQRGWSVEVFLYGDETKLPPDAAENCRRWRELGEIETLAAVMEREWFDFDLVVDAIFGTGLSRPIIDQELQNILWHIEDCSDVNEDTTLDYRAPVGTPHIIAVDAPSGLCLDSGTPLGERTGMVPGSNVARASLTVTFERAKVGHFLDEGYQRCGKVTVVGLGIKAKLQDAVKLNHLAFPWMFSPNEKSHKYSHGHTLIVSGGMAKTGAARLAARGALRIGAGLVTVASPPDALMENAAHLTAIMLQKMKGPEGLAAILSDTRINSVVIGPGCGVGEETRALVSAALERTPHSPPRGEEWYEPRTVILDADALTSYPDAFTFSADDPETLFTAIKASPCSVILTPHGGEFARLFPDLAAKLTETPTKGPAYSKVDVTREAAARSGATVLFKGADTVIAKPDGRCSIAAAVYERAAPWLATAGSGDVLAGMIAGLAARGISDPAASAAWLHQECGRHLGPGLIAEDIPEAIPSVLKRVLGWQPPKS